MKSNVSDYLELAHAVYYDACAKCVAEVSDLRDLDTLRSRVEQEGVSFLTLTLPTFCRDFEKALADGFIDSTSFRNFRKFGAIPAFLRGMLSRLFDHETGRILKHDADSPTIVAAVRQVCLLFKKVELPCSPPRAAAALDNFVETERLLQTFSVPDETKAAFLAVSRILWTSLLSTIRMDDLVPRHGPGTTAEQILGNQKFVWQCWYERLERSVPFVGNAVTFSAVSDGDILQSVRFVPEEEENPSRIILVPKTLKSPRVIAAEPVCMQFVQQGISSLLVDALERSSLVGGHINFRDQSVNQRLALSASSDGRWATIDLSDASDRVPADLALEMFSVHPQLMEAVDSCRTRRSILPDGRLVSLKKFASMGSALCFPVEAMYFYTCCVVALTWGANLPVTRATVKQAARNIYVYGDDIIVPADKATAVIDTLQQYNCKANPSKSFWTGKFRESCGVDAYDGELVTPTYIRKERPNDRQQVDSIVSWVKTANLFYMKGFWRTASHMYATCEKLIGNLPYVGPHSPLLGRVSLMGYRTIGRWSDSLHSPQVRGYVVRPVYSCDNIDGHAALWKCLSILERRPPRKPWTDASLWVEEETYPHHLEQSVRRGAVTLKLRWVALD